VVEEGVGGGTWGAEVAHRIHTLFWDRLDAPVRLVHSRDEVIPAAPSLEQDVLIQTGDIVRALLGDADA
jgi:pyruvate dehydrogenase E1 component beta subunit